MLERMFLMHRVELKELYLSVNEIARTTFLMHRVELKDKVLAKLFLKFTSS